MTAVEHHQEQADLAGYILASISAISGALWLLSMISWAATGAVIGLICCASITPGVSAVLAWVWWTRYHHVVCARRLGR